MTTHHQPFRLVLRACVPVVLTDFAPTLDALVYEALSAQSPGLTRDELLERMKSVLSYHEKFSVFHGSALLFGLTPERGLVAQTYVRTDYLNEDKLSSRMFQPRQRAGKFTKLNLGGGPTKRRLISRPAYAAPFLVFDGHGDPWQVKNLLEHFVMGVGYDAGNVGMGCFDQIEVVPLAVDSSLLTDGQVQRPMPAMDGLDGIQCNAVLTPPYYRTHTAQPAIVPAKVRSAFLKNLI